MKNISIFDIERGGTGIEQNGTGIEKGGTGIEKGGTGVEKGGTGIEKGGTGFRALGRFRLAAVGLLLGGLLSTSALAAPTGTWEDWGDVGGTVQFGVKADTLTASWSTFDHAGNPILLVGTANMSKDVVNMRLFKVESGYHGRGAEPMPFMQPWGRAKLNFDGCGNAHGTVLKVEGSGTGDKVEGSGTGDKVEGSGTGDKVEGSGTGDKVEGSGTGDKVEGSGTGDKVEGSGTGDKVEGSGTGDKLAFYGDVVLVGPGKAGGCQ